MLFKSTLLFGLASVAVATQADSQIASDLQAMAASFDKIFIGIDSILLVVNKVADKAGVDEIVSGFAVIDKAIAEGAASIKKSAGMSIAELLNILGPVGVMQDKVAEVVKTLSSKKTALEGLGAKETIVTELQKTKTTADDLVNAIKGNLPLSAITGPFAGPIAATITDELVKGIREWGGEVAGPAPKAAAQPRPAKGSAPKATASPPAKGPAVAMPEKS
ncbi:hypothetical protein EJ08DRAFT_651130 [Tothia fuscella]|uniref:Cell wall protein n=1 Tax=Tothia fuscella TaxID=1048955 RepID=A0A9P4NMS8_9PEZI|nr:hypothetical protein EJ08DRAFT_651130 [Tothia fuscella]